MKDVRFESSTPVSLCVDERIRQYCTLHPDVFPLLKCSENYRVIDEFCYRRTVVAGELHLTYLAMNHRKAICYAS
jgi:hypothetical protein